MRPGTEGHAAGALPPESERDAPNACSAHVLRERKTPKHNRCFRSGGRGKRPLAADEKYHRAIREHPVGEQAPAWRRWKQVGNTPVTELDEPWRFITILASHSKLAVRA